MRVLAWPAFRNKFYQPYNYLLYSHLKDLGVDVVEFSPQKLLFGRYDLWHMHWPENRLASRNFLLAVSQMTGLFLSIYLAKARGTKIVWTAHNLKQHEGYHSRLERFYWHRFTKLLDGWIALSASGEQAARETFRHLRPLPATVTPHGHYRGMYPDHVTKAVAREKLSVPPNAKVTTFLGQVRAYKNVPHLVRTFRALPDKDVFLIVAGKAKDAALEREIREAAGDDQRVSLSLDFVSNDDLQYFLRASDFLTVPYQDVFNSGSALLALSFNIPIFVPDLGSMGELKTYAGHDWVKTYKGALTATTLSEGFAWSTLEERPPLNLESLNWDQIAKTTFQAYQHIVKAGN